MFSDNIRIFIKKPYKEDYANRNINYLIGLAKINGIIKILISQPQNELANMENTKHIMCGGWNGQN